MCLLGVQCCPTVSWATFGTLPKISNRFGHYSLPDELLIIVKTISHARRCPWCNGYRRRKWTR